MTGYPGRRSVDYFPGEVIMLFWINSEKKFKHKNYLKLYKINKIDYRWADLLNL